jgi:hypothetical protein
MPRLAGTAFLRCGSFRRIVATRSKSTAARANQKARGHRKPRFRAANYKDIRRDLRAMDRNISNQQIEPHQNVSGMAAMLFADLCRVPSRCGRGMSRR